MTYNKNTCIFLNSVSAEGLAFGQFQLAVTLGCASAPSVSFGDQQLSGRGGGALIIKVLSRGQEIVMPLGAQLRTGKSSLPPAFHWPMQVTWPNNSGARKETLGTGRRLHGQVTWVKGMDA